MITDYRVHTVSTAMISHTIFHIPCLAAMINAVSPLYRGHDYRDHDTLRVKEYAWLGNPIPILLTSTRR